MDDLEQALIAAGFNYRLDVRHGGRDNGNWTPVAYSMGRYHHEHVANLMLSPDGNDGIRQIWLPENKVCWQVWYGDDPDGKGF